MVKNKLNVFLAAGVALVAVAGLFSSQVFGAPTTMTGTTGLSYYWNAVTSKFTAGEDFAAGGPTVMSGTNVLLYCWNSSTSKWTACGDPASSGSGSGTIATSTALTIGQILYVTGTGYPSTVSSAATTTLTATSPLVLSNAISVIGSSASDITCNAASGSQAGCLSATNWNTFNNKWDLASSTIGNAYLTNSTISGVALGSNLAALTNDATLAGSSYNGSGAISDWGLNLANANTWTALQTFTNASTTGTHTINELCFSTGQCMSAPSISGSLISLFHHNTAAEYADYEQLRTFPPTGTEVDESCTANSDTDGGYCDIEAGGYISTTTDLMLDELPSGTWDFRKYVYTDNTAGLNKVESNIYKRDAAGVETYLFQATSTDFDITSVGIQEYSIAASAYTFSPTDRIVIKLRMWTDSNAGRLIHIVYGSTNHYSRIITPITLANFDYAIKSANETISGSWTHSGKLTMGNASSTALTITSGLDVDTLTSALVLTGAGGDFAEYAGATCTNQFPRSLSALGAATCASVANTDLVSSTISGVSLGSNLAALTNGATLNGSSYNGSGAISDWDINLANPNTWTGLQQFNNASTTLFSSAYASSTLYFGAGLANCSSENMLTWTDGRFGCESDTAGAGGGVGTISTSTTPTIGQLAYWTSAGYPSLLGSAATTTLTENSLALALSQPISVIGGSASVLSLSTSTLFSYPWLVAEGGTGAVTLTDGGILLGSGTGAITPMGVLADGAIVVGDGTTDPVALTAFTSSTGQLKHESGGLEFDASAITTGGIIRGSAAGTMAILALGTPGQILGSTAGQLGYIATTTIPLAGSVGGTLSATSLNTDAVDAITEIAAALKDGSGDCGTGLLCLGDHTHATLYSPIAGSASIVTLGTIATGVWNGTAISTAYGGTGILSAGGIQAGSIPYGNGASAFATSTALQFASSRLTVTYASSTAMTITSLWATNLLGAIDAGGATSLEIPNGTAPTMSAVGQIAFDTSDNQFLIGTSTVNDPAVIPTRIKLFGGGISSTSPDFVSGGIIPASQQIDGFIIDQISCQVDGGTSVVLTFSDVAGATDSNSVTCDTNGQTDAVTANRTYAAGSFNRFEIGTVTGAVDYLTYSVYGYILRE